MAKLVINNNNISDIKMNLVEIKKCFVGKVNSISSNNFKTITVTSFFDFLQPMESIGLDFSTSSTFDTYTRVELTNTTGTQTTIFNITPGNNWYVRPYMTVDNTTYTEYPFCSEPKSVTIPSVPTIPEKATRFTTTSTNTLTLRFTGYTPNEYFYINWGDGNDNSTYYRPSSAIGAVTHTYSTKEVRYVYVFSESTTDQNYGKMPRIYGDNATAMQITSLDTPLQNLYSGTTQYTLQTADCMYRGFLGSTNLTSVCKDWYLNIKGNGNLASRSMYYAFGNTKLSTIDFLDGLNPTANDAMYYCLYYNKSMNYIKVTFTTYTSGALNNWVQAAPSSGNFYCPSTLSIPTGASGIPSGWTRHDLT